MCAEVASLSQSLSKQLVGTWILSSRVDRDRDGERRVEPMLGEDPVALLYYDASGYFAAQFMKRNRNPDDAALGGNVGLKPSASLGHNNTRAQGGYDAYFGTYTVDDAEGTVTQTLLGALSAPNVGQVLTRAMRVDGDTLTISLDTVAADGVPVTRTLVWHRAKRRS